MILAAAQEWDGRSRASGADGRPRVRIIVAGAPPPTRTIERVETELGWEFIQIYGLTETAPLLTMNRSRSRMGRADAGGPGAKLGRGRRPGARHPPGRGSTTASCWPGATSC